VFRHEIAGPGGWGDPLERDPQRVLRDVRNELVSNEVARRNYGVVIDTAAWTVDEKATSQLREKLRARRGNQALPDVIWDDGFSQMAAE
jgi:N-methylhydantoinase B